MLPAKKKPRPGQQKVRMLKRRQKKKLPYRNCLSPRRLVFISAMHIYYFEKKKGLNVPLLGFHSQEEKGNTVETVMMMKPAPPRANRTLIQIQTPIALTNLKRGKMRTRMRRKKRGKVRNRCQYYTQFVK